MGAALLLLGAVLAGCGSSPGAASKTTTAPAAGAASSGKVTVDTASSSRYGTVLVTASGRTLYLLTADTAHTVKCTGSCTSVWPPLTGSGATAGSGVQQSLLGTVSRPGGGRQVTYGGHPLYTYSGDSAKGQANGEGIASFGGTWYVLGPSGKPVTAARSGTTTTTGGSGGYGY